MLDAIVLRALLDLVACEEETALVLVIGETVRTATRTCSMRGRVDAALSPSM